MVIIEIKEELDEDIHTKGRKICLGIKTYRKARGNVVTHNVTIGIMLEASMGRSYYISNLEKSIGIDEYSLDNICGIHGIKTHAIQCTLAVGVTGALIILTICALFKREINLISITRVSTHAAAATKAIRVRKASFDLWCEK